MNTEQIKNELAYREEYRKYVKEARKIAIMDNFKKLMMQDIENVEDQNIQNTLNTFEKQNILESTKHIYDTYLKPKEYKLNILSFEEWVRKYK